MDFQEASSGSNPSSTFFRASVTPASSAPPIAAWNRRRNSCCSEVTRCASSSRAAFVAVRLILNLRLSLFFVPFRGFVKFLDYLVLQFTDFSLQLRQVAPDDRLRRFLQNLFHAPQVFPEAPERFRKRLIRRVANAILLQRQRCVQQRASSRQAVDRFFGPRNVRLHHLLDLPVESRQCLPGGFFKRRTNALVDFLDQRSRTAVQFVAVQVQNVLQLGLKSSECLLFDIFELLCVVLDPLA